MLQELCIYKGSRGARVFFTWKRARSSSELLTTATEEKAIMAAAAEGFSAMPMLGSSAPAWQVSGGKFGMGGGACTYKRVG